MNDIVLKGRSMKQKQSSKKHSPSRCFIFTDRNKGLETGNDKAGLFNISRRTLLTGATIIGISLYGGFASGKDFSPLQKDYSKEVQLTSSSDLKSVSHMTGEKISLNVQVARSLEFSEGLAKINSYGKYGYIDEWGTMAIEPAFEDARNFSGGLAGVMIGGKWGYIDKTGSIVINFQFEDVRDFSEGLGAVKIKDKWGYIEKTGNIVIKPQFDVAKKFSNGRAYVEIEDKWRYINKNGEYVKITPQEKIIPAPNKSGCTGGCIASCITCTGSCTGGCTSCTRGCVSCTGCTGCTTGCISGCTTGCVICTSCTYCTYSCVSGCLTVIHY